MPPRTHLCTYCLSRKPARNPLRSSSILKHASTATAYAPSSTTVSSPSISYPSTQPPSHKPPEYRKSQLHRQYTSLLRSSPLLLVFHHSNLTANEWMGIRRELSKALLAVDKNHSSLASTATPIPPLADRIKFNIVQTRLLESALLVVDHFHPDSLPPPPPPPSSSPPTTTPPTAPPQIFTHALSRTAYLLASKHKKTHDLRPLMCGPVAILSFPTLSPPHLKAALSILSPKPPFFAAPPRRTNPGYYDAAVQTGLQKLMLLAARAEGKVFDIDETRWLGGIEGGLDVLRAQLVAVLGSVGVGLARVLEGPGRNVYGTLEGRRSLLEEEQRGGEEGKEMEKEGEGGENDTIV